MKSVRCALALAFIRICMSRAWYSYMDIGVRTHPSTHARANRIWLSTSANARARLSLDACVPLHHMRLVVRMRIMPNPFDFRGPTTQTPKDVRGCSETTAYHIVLHIATTTTANACTLCMCAYACGYSPSLRLLCAAAVLCAYTRAGFSKSVRKLNIRVRDSNGYYYRIFRRRTIIFCVLRASCYVMRLIWKVRMKRVA